MRSRQYSEDLLSAADFFGLEAGRNLDAERQGEMGRFLTPPLVARFMATMLELDRPSVRLLDPGAGVGALTAAVAMEVMARVDGPRELHVVAYEVDGGLERGLTNILEMGRIACESAGVSFVGESIVQDFVQAGGRLRLLSQAAIQATLYA